MSNTEGQTALFLAMFYSCDVTCDMLLSAGANPDQAMTTSGYAPLHAICSEGSLPLLKLALSYGASGNVCSADR